MIVGDNRTWPRTGSAGGGGGARRRRHESNLRSYVPDAELASLYARAAVFVFLSEYEGFGLTPLEALRAGVPIVVLDTPVAREVYGDAAVYVRQRRHRRHRRSDPSECCAIRRAPRRSSPPRPRCSGATPGTRAADQTLAALEGTRALTPRLAIVIVSYNAREHVENCLASLADAPPATPHEVVVVDNASI